MPVHPFHILCTGLPRAGKHDKMTVPYPHVKSKPYAWQNTKKAACLSAWATGFRRQQSHIASGACFVLH